VSDARVHPDARGFDQAAAAYERARPSYPQAAVAWLAERLGLRPGRRVLDLAAGTGKLTRHLVQTGADVVAVEPVAGMRSELERVLPGIEVLDGLAEAIPLPDGAVDAVAVGQAFHWFHPEVALGELHRVLRRGGGLGLVWNTRDEADPLHRQATAIIESLRGEAPPVDTASVLRTTPLFERYDEASFRHEQRLDADGFVARFLSVSFVASSPPDVREAVARRLRELVREAREPIVLPYATDTYVAYRRQPTTEYP
jgi:ubiquinone/menaquinone biosynthesis C-methylase UbiE